MVIFLLITLQLKTTLCSCVFVFILSLHLPRARFWRGWVYFSISLIGINIRCKVFISRAAIAFSYYSGFLIFIFLKAYANSRSKLLTLWSMCKFGFSRWRLSQLAIATLSGHVKNWEAEDSHRFHMLPRERSDYLSIIHFILFVKQSEHLIRITVRSSVSWVVKLNAISVLAFSIRHSILKMIEDAEINCLSVEYQAPGDFPLF